jgi:tRNA A58 N-methylase Trm61
MSVKVVDTWSASEYNKTAPFVYSTEHTTPILTLLDPQPGDKIIDFGCGSGEVTLKLSEVVADVGIVMGVDSSQSMASTITLSVELDVFLTSSRRSKRLRKTGWKTSTSKISSRWTMSSHPDF